MIWTPLLKIFRRNLLIISIEIQKITLGCNENMAFDVYVWIQYIMRVVTLKNAVLFILVNLEPCHLNFCLVGVLLTGHCYFYKRNPQICTQEIHSIHESISWENEENFQIVLLNLQSVIRARSIINNVWYASFYRTRNSS